MKIRRFDDGTRLVVQILASSDQDAEPIHVTESWTLRHTAGLLIEQARVLDEDERRRDRMTNYSPMRHVSPRWWLKPWHQQRWMDHLDPAVARLMHAVNITTDVRVPRGLLIGVAASGGVPVGEVPAGETVG